MKRSEMKARLIEVIYDYVWCDAADEFADHMLSFLESQGMQPPPVRVLKESTVFNQETGEWGQGKISCTVNEWELEE